MAIDIMHAFSETPQEIDFVWGGGPAIGTVGALISPGGVGKSFFALQASIAVAGGPDLLGIQPPRTGRVVYLAAEDPEIVLHHRLHAIGRHLCQRDRETVAKDLTIEPIIGKKLDIMSISHMRRVIEYSAGARLIVIDTLSRVHSLDENNNSVMAVLISTLEYIAVQTGASILYLHHANKWSAKDGLTDQQAARGASALIDTARWCGYVVRMTEAEASKLADQGSSIIGSRRGLYVRYGVSKGNYGPIPPDRWYRRHEGGVLLPVDLVDVKSNKKAGRRDNNDDF